MEVGMGSDDDMEDYGFEYSDDEPEEQDVDVDNQYYNSKSFGEVVRMEPEKIPKISKLYHLPNLQKKFMDPVLPDLGESEKMKESGFIIPQEIPSHSWLRRGLDAAPNRCGIKPGRHWDGVDRSTGYEKGLFKRTNVKKATEQEAYLWSVSDM